MKPMKHFLVKGRYFSYGDTRKNASVITTN